MSLPAALCAAVFWVAGSGTARAKDGLADLNTASLQELEAVSGITPGTARKIIAGRPYKSVDDLVNAGIPAKKIDVFKSAVTIGTAAPAPASGAKPAVPAPPPALVRTSAALVDINNADEATLETLPGISAALASEIVKGRPYKSVDDLRKVTGVSRLKLDALRDKVKVGEPPAPAAVEPASPAAQVIVTPSVSDTSATARVVISVKTNLAAVGTQTSSVPDSAKTAAVQRVNINFAGKDEIAALPGIGPMKAQAIIKDRPYAKIEDVMKVKGLTENEFEGIRNLITVE